MKATILITKPNGDEFQIHNHASLYRLDGKALVWRSNPCACFFLGPVVVELLVRQARRKDWRITEFRLGEFWRYKKAVG